MPQFVTPVAGRLTQPFIPGQHYGVDIGAVDHSTVVAAESGRVIFEGIWGLGGNTIHIKGSDGYVTIYCHLSKFIVNMGSTVTQGQAIAQSGGVLGEQGAGNSKGAHLHFEIHTPNFSEANPSASAVNPQMYISVGGADISSEPVRGATASGGGIKGELGGKTSGIGGTYDPLSYLKNPLDALSGAGKALSFLTTQSNWIRIGEFTAGAAILVLVFSKTLGQTQAVQSLTKVAAVAA